VSIVYAALLLEQTQPQQPTTSAFTAAGLSLASPNRVSNCVLSAAVRLGITLTTRSTMVCCVVGAGVDVGVAVAAVEDIVSLFSLRKEQHNVSCSEETCGSQELHH
jgi:hypothetical protein